MYQSIVQNTMLAENTVKVKALEKENGDLHNELDESKEEFHYLKKKLDSKYNLIEDMEHEETLPPIPQAPPQPTPSTSTGLIPPPPSLTQMRPRTPPATYSRHNAQQ